MRDHTLEKFCCVPLCTNPVSREETITYRSIYNNLVTARVYFCKDCKSEDLLQDVTPEIKLMSGGY